MAHEEVIRILPEADTAVLLMHGIAGTPDHFHKVLPLMQRIPENWSVYALRYPGHGETADDFAHSSLKQWREYAYKIYDSLAENHKKVILIGHSMGNLFAMQLGLAYPDKIPFIFMLAAPMRPWPRLFGMVNLLRLTFGKLDMSDPLQASTSMVCGLTTTKKLWKYVKWIPRMLELFGEIARTEKVMGNLQVPCVALQSRKDELVSNFSRGVLEKSGVVEIHELAQSTHFYYAPLDREIVFKEFEEKINAYLKGKADS